MRVGVFIGSSKRRLASLAAVVTLGLSLTLVPTASAITIGGPSDCDSNAIIRCGAHSTQALQRAYNTDSYVQKVFAHFGVTQTEMSNLEQTNVAGRVTSDGKVFVNSQSDPVATGAVTGGRQNMPGSTPANANGAVFYKRPPSASFQQASLPAFVSMKNGRFQFAVIASCGNAVRATPTEAPKAAVGPAQAVSRAQPQPQPRPAPSAPSQSQQQQQSQSQQVNINNSDTQTVQSAPAPATAQPATQEVAGKLPNVGPSGTAGVFLASVGLGAWAYRRFILRKILE